MNEATIFANALEKKTKEDLAAYLDQACSGNQELRLKIERLLAAANGTDPILDQKFPPMPSTCSVPMSEKAGSSIGPYRLMEQIGEGGFGLVFVAEQQTPVRRRVALKVIKPGMDSKQVIARFEAERQALALMDHPNIAKVLDVGSTESGLPFFVMELVRGVPITEYCDTNHLDPAARLEIFISVCKAIQHAHQKGVIHRDIKPSNVLVTSHDGKPVAKVIDFGVAKAIHQPLTERTIYTQFSQMIGTPLYMSPEQAEMSGLDIDTRSDIYSLGVLLYELLTGSTPLEKKQLVSAAYDEIRRLIREEEPPKPSQRLSASETLVALSASRATEPARLTKLLRGEVDWIVMKALEKDRTRRYDSAGALAADVARYLSNDPVEACPPSTLYRLQKAIRRNRTALGAGGILAASLLLGIWGTTWFAIHANRQAKVALEQMRLAEDSQANAEGERNKAESARNLATEKNESLLKAQERQREMLYASDMNLIQTAWSANDHRRAIRLLNKHRPLPGERDLRGFEWGYWNRKLHAENESMQLVGRIPKSEEQLPDTLTALGSEGSHFAIFDPNTHLLKVMQAGTAHVLWEKRLSNNPWYLDLDHENQVVIVVNYEIPNRTDRYVVFDSKSGEELYQKKVILPHLGFLRMRPFSKAGSRIATILPGDEKDSLLVWDIRSGKDLALHPFPKRQLEIAGTRPIRFLESYQRVLIGKDEKTFGIHTLRVGVGHLASWYDEAGLKFEISMGTSGYMAMSPDGSLLVIAKERENGRQVLEFRDGRDVSQIKQTVEVPKLSSSSFLQFTSDSQFLLSSTYDAPGLFLVDCRESSYRWKVLPSQSEILHASFDPKSFVVRWFNQEGQIISRSTADLFKEEFASISTTWRLTKSSSNGSRFALLPSIGDNANELGESNVMVVDGGCNILFQLNDVTDGRGTRCAFSGDGKRIVILTKKDAVDATSHELRLLDATSGRELARKVVRLRTPFPNAVEAPIALDFKGHRMACISLDDKETNRRILTIWNADDSDRELLSVPVEEMDQGDLQWSNDGRFLLGRSESAIHLCDVSTGRKLWSSGQPSHTACFSRDCSWLLSVESETDRWNTPMQKENCQLVIRESLTGKEIDRLELGERLGRNEPVTQFIALSSDKRYVAAILQEAQVGVWDLTETSRQPKILPCGWGTVFAVSFSDDGNRLVTSAARRWGSALDSIGETSVWNHVTGEQLLTVPSSSNTLIFEAEGKLIHGARRTRHGLSQIEIDARPLAPELEAIHWAAALQEIRFDGEPPTMSQMLESIQADRIASQEVRDATIKQIAKRPNSKVVEAGWRLVLNRDSNLSKLEQAVAYFREASELESSNPTIWRGQALAYARLEDSVQATKAWGRLKEVLQAKGITSCAEDKAVEAFVDLAKDSKIDLLARVREIRLTPSRDELQGKELLEFLLSKLPVPDPESDPSHWIGKYLVPKPSRFLRHMDGRSEFPYTITNVKGSRIYCGTSWIEHCDALLAEDAELYLTRHIQMFPEDLDGLQSRSQVRRGFGNIQGALEDLDHAISIASSTKSDFEKDWYRLEKIDMLFENGEYAMVIEKCMQIQSDSKQIHSRVLSVQARICASCPEDRFRDGAKGVALAKESCNVGGWSNYRLVEVLALAYAEAGDFDEAIRWIDEAIKLAGHAEVRLDFEKYRQKFVDNQPHRHEPNPGPLFK